MLSTFNENTTTPRFPISNHSYHAGCIALVSSILVYSLSHRHQTTFPRHFVCLERATQDGARSLKPDPKYGRLMCGAHQSTQNLHTELLPKCVLVHKSHCVIKCGRIYCNELFLFKVWDDIKMDAAWREHK